MPAARQGDHRHHRMRQWHSPALITPLPRPADRPIKHDRGQHREHAIHRNEEYLVGLDLLTLEFCVQQPGKRQRDAKPNSAKNNHAARLRFRLRSAHGSAINRRTPTTGENWSR